MCTELGGELMRRRVMSFVKSIIGGDDVVHGSFTPAEATLEYTIDTGIDCNHILLWIDDDSYATGNGHKTASLIFANLSDDKYYVVSTNNGGTAPTGLIPSTVNKEMAYVEKNGTEIKFIRNASTGSVFGYFEPVKYNYVAWK